MGVPFKKIARKDPRKADAVAKFYPQLVTLGDNATLDDIAYVRPDIAATRAGQKIDFYDLEALVNKGDGEGGSSGGGSGSGDGGGSDGDQGENPLG